MQTSREVSKAAKWAGHSSLPLFFMVTERKVHVGQEVEGAGKGRVRGGRGEVEGLHVRSSWL